MTVLRILGMHLLTRGGHGFQREGDILSPHPYPWRGILFEFHTFPLPYFRISFILPCLLAILNLSQ
jgi:hypothetical protein